MRRLDVEGELEPLRGAFDQASRDHDVVPVALEVHSDSLTPVGAFGRLVGSGPGFLLESVEDGQRFGRYSFLGRRPLGVYALWPESVEASGTFAAWSETRDPWRAVEGNLGALRVSEPVSRRPLVVPLRSGVVGLFGWDAVRSLERLPPRHASTSRQPDAILATIGELVVFDHWRQVITLVANVDTRGTESSFEQVVGRLVQLVQDLGRGGDEYLGPSRGRHEMPIAQHDRTVASSQYQLMVEAAKEEIARGECFQVVLSQRFDVGPVDDAFSVYRVLRQMNPSSYLYFLQLGGVRVAGSSPEPLVRVRDRRVTVRPIAGSRPRGEDERENALRAATLVEDPKEVAEHIMLVDLGRNDVGRVAQYGSVEVEELMTVETYSHIMHLTSQVSGQLRDGVGPVEVLRATFPAGTLSGAPKVRAMELITEMEPQSRGLYGGAVAYFDARGNLDAAIIIRTLVVDADGKGSVQTGAGIVWDSDPQAEDLECLAKAEAVLRSVGGARS